MSPAEETFSACAAQVDAELNYATRHEDVCGEWQYRSPSFLNVWHDAG